jgi:hypothetical protein
MNRAARLSARQYSTLVALVQGRGHSMAARILETSVVTIDCLLVGRARATTCTRIGERLNRIADKAERRADT